MSLLTDAMEYFVIVNDEEVIDGYGGHHIVWTDGETISAALVRNPSETANRETKIAEKSESKNYYTVITEKSINLQFHEVLRRVSDGMVLRITTKGTDNCTPTSAWLNMRQVKAEEWSIPDG